KELRGRWSNLHALVTTGTGVLESDMANDPELRRYIVKLLGAFFADHFQRCAVLDAALLGLGKIVHDLDARQIRRQRLAPRLLALVRRDAQRLGRRARRRRMRDRLRLVEQELRLIG